MSDPDEKEAYVRTLYDTDMVNLFGRTLLKASVLVPRSPISPEEMIGE
jgi:hypothetical protein